MEKDKISIIVTTFNRKKSLIKTVKSIINQSYKNIEIIIVDNFSNYNFFKLIKSFNDKRIFPYQNKNNNIISINRNFGVKQSSSDFITFCDDDDIWFIDKLKYQLEVFKKNKEIILNSTLAISVGYKSYFLGSNYGLLYRKINLNKNFILKYNPIILSSVMMRKKSFMDLNGFSEEKKLVSIEDLDLWLRAHDFGKISILNDIMVSYTHHSKNTSKYYINLRKEYFKEKNISYMRNKYKTQTNFLLNLIRSLIHFLNIKKIYLYKYLRKFFNINLFRIISN
tara:strand:- start:1424 stop:2266 length:843 start_codon:yes stop_codon:yes gene_type:complete